MAAKKKRFEVLTNIYSTATGKYHDEGAVIELDAKEGARLIGLGLVVSTDGSVTASEPEPQEQEREPVGKPRSFKAVKPKGVKNG